MPDGRFLSKSIAYSAQVGSVSLEADYLFMRMIPHLDSAGRMIGEPMSVKALCCPLRSEITGDVVERCLGELHQAGLLTWYKGDGQRYVEMPGFVKHQRGARLDREAPSRLPAPSTKKVRRTPENSGERRVSEVKRSEEKVSEEKTTPLPPTQTKSDAIRTTGAVAPTADERRVLDHFTTCHPRRKWGTKDVKLVRQRIAEGFSADQLCQAISGNAHDSWHQERRKHELSYVLRDAGMVSKFSDCWQSLLSAAMSGKDYWDNPELQRLTSPVS